jgi:hypothetical protein
MIYEVDDNSDGKKGRERKEEEQLRRGGVFKLEIRVAPPLSTRGFTFRGVGVRWVGGLVTGRGVD